MSGTKEERKKVEIGPKLTGRETGKTVKGTTLYRGVGGDGEQRLWKRVNPSYRRGPFRGASVGGGRREGVNGQN